MIYLGVDPGSTGAVALLDDAHPDSWSWDVWKLEGTSPGAHVCHTDQYPAEWSFVAAEHAAFTVAVEKVSASPIQSPSSAFTFGRNYQWCLDFFQPDLLPLPQQWQRLWAGNLAGKKKDERKRALWNLAKVYVPDVPKYAADAVLIAVWARTIKH